MLKNIINLVQHSMKARKAHECLICGRKQDRPFCSDHIHKNPYIARIMRVVARLGPDKDIPSVWNIKEVS